MRRELAWWLLALLVLRGLLIVSLSDVFFFGEELEKGTAAKAMLDGIDVAHHRLAYHYYEGGGFAISHLRALAFLVFGENLLALRACGLLTCALVFLALWRLVDHHFGRRAARCAALLFLFGPACLQRYSLLSLGIHFEAMAFGLFVLDEGLRLAFEREREASARRLAVLGLVSGFGLFFSYQNALAIGWSGLLILLFRPRVLFSRAGAASVGGLAVGLTPLLVMAALVGDALLDVHGTDLAVGGAARVAAFLRGVYLDAGAWDALVRGFYPFAALVAVGLALSGLQGPQRRAAWGLTGFALLWTVVWALGPFVHAHVVGWYVWLRMAPLALVLLALGAAGADAALARGGLRGRFGGVLLGAVLLLGVTHTGRIAAAGRPTSPLDNLRFLASMKGYDYRGYFPMLLGHLDGRSSKHLAPLLEFDEPDRDLLRSALAIALFENRRRAVELPAQLETLERLEPEGRDGFLLGLGPSVIVNRRGDVGAALKQLAALPDGAGAPWAEAMGYFPGHRNETWERLLEDVAAHGRGPLGPAYLRGVGARAFRAQVMSTAGGELMMDEVTVRERLAAFPDGQAAHLLRGFGEERARWTLEPSPAE